MDIYCKRCSAQIAADAINLDSRLAYCTQRISQNNNRTTTTYELRMIDKHGRDRKLLKLDEPGQALYLEQLFEDTLGLTDVKVPGEIG